MLYGILSIFLLSAAACFGLDRHMPTRRIGLTLAAISVLAAIALALEPWVPFTFSAVELLQLGDVSFSLAPTLADEWRLLAISTLTIGGMAMLVLAEALPPTVTGFGTIFVWTILALASTLLNLAAPPESLITPLAWTLATVTCFAAIQASGGLAQYDRIPHGLVFGLIAAGIWLGAIIIRSRLLPGDNLGTAIVGGGLLLATLALTGAAPFAGALDDAAEAPATLGSLIYSLVLPTVGLSSLIRAYALVPSIPATWEFTLIGVGSIGVLASAAAVHAEQRLRLRLARFTSMQISLIVAGIGVVGVTGIIPTFTLLLSMQIATLAMAVAITVVEQTVGDDDLTHNPTRKPPFWAGWLWLASGAAIVGLPPFASFWSRLWTLTPIGQAAVWALPIIIAGAALSMAAVITALPHFWGYSSAQEQVSKGRSSQVIGGVSIGVIVIGGLWPHLLWSAIPAQSVAAVPIDAQLQAGIILLALIIAAGAWYATRITSGRQPGQTEDGTARLTGAAIIESLAPLIQLSYPRRILHTTWGAIIWLSDQLRLAVSFFEQRFYLLGVLLALILIMLIMAQ
jgi:hypothetical protein